MELVSLGEGDTREPPSSLCTHERKACEEESIGGGGYLQARKRALTETKSARTLMSDFPASRTVENRCLLFKPEQFNPVTVDVLVAIKMW